MAERDEEVKEEYEKAKPFSRAGRMRAAGVAMGTIKKKVDDQRAAARRRAEEERKKKVGKQKTGREEPGVQADAAVRPREPRKGQQAGLRPPRKGQTPAKRAPAKAQTASVRGTTSKEQRGASREAAVMTGGRGKPKLPGLPGKKK
tara:strand:+ start:602 stop:1039 length:438 start_codon:yes stop_codon:yes gene_type:complete